MYAPSSIELDKDVLSIVEDDALELLANKVIDTLVLGLGNGLTLKLGLETTIEIPGNPVGDASGVDWLRLIKGVLELFHKVLDDKAGPFGFLKVESFAMVAEFNGINPNKVDL